MVVSVIKSTERKYGNNMAVVFDRDGTLTNLVAHDYRFTAPWKFSEFSFKDNVVEAVKIVRDLGYYTFILSNQPDYGRELLPKEYEKMVSALNDKIKMDDSFYIQDRASFRYKPRTDAVTSMVERYSIDPAQSFFVGDTWKDVVCGENSGMTTIYIGSEHFSIPDEFAGIRPDYTATDVLAACKIIHDIRITNIVHGEYN
jgi:D-glycero-D-manno-heptose 1,7-bisphosphate phosphatase